MAAERALFPIRKIVNVATVPLRSPFRYPGGKTWLIPYVRQWLTSLDRRPAEFIDPFAGGGIVGLTVAFENYADKVTLVELDPDVASVWKTILNGQSERLTDRIRSFQPSKEAVRTILQTPVTTDTERALLTIVKNRMQRGGILAPGAGLLKKGENRKGLTSRWYPGTLERRIRDIAGERERIQFIEGDGFSLIRRNKNRKNVCFFIDPPYTVAGRRLYACSEVDHEALFDLCAEIQGAFLMTFDKTNEILTLARKHRLAFKGIRMKSTHHEKKTELLISRNLDWLL